MTCFAKSIVMLLFVAQRTASAWTASSSRSLPTLNRVASATSRCFASTTDADTATKRLPRQDLSLELRTIQNHLDVVKSHLVSRRASEETIAAAEKIASLTADRSNLIQERDAALNQRKSCSAIVGKYMRIKDELTDEQKAELEEAKEQSTQAAAEAEAADTKLAEIQGTMDSLLACIPNLLEDFVPEGSDDTDNEEVYKWGDIETMPAAIKQSDKYKWTDDFEPKWHDDVALALGGYQSEAAVAMSGARFVALSGAVAQLERALAMFFIDHHVNAGYTEVSVPLIVSRTALEGTSQLPKFQEDLFAITKESHTCNGEDAFLIPTAEVPVTNIHRDSVLEEDDLPLSYVAWTPCFRAEAGSYGRDTKGLIRTHQFQKVELVKITNADTSNEEHESLTKQAETCLQLLELPYRKVRLCSGDTGFSARHCYDLEVWLPGANEYREISSCSNTGDFQARRMGLRYRPKPKQDDNDEDNGSNKKAKKNNKKPKPEFCHTINGSGLAVGRALVAVLENYQTVDGSVIVPEVLRPYMGGKAIISAPQK